MSNMSPSSEIKVLTSGQIGKFEEVFGAGLRKANLPSEASQIVLETQADDLVAELVASVRNRVETVSNMIVRHVRVNRDRTPQQVLDATGCKQYTDKDVVAGMPNGEDEEVDVYFFKVGRYLSDDELEKEYALRGLIPADPYSQAAVNEADPAFVDEHPNGTHWKDSKGSWCFAAFARWNGERKVRVDRRDYVWYDFWWFAGLRK